MGGADAASGARVGPRSQPQAGQHGAGRFAEARQTANPRAQRRDVMVQPARGDRGAHRDAEPAGPPLRHPSGRMARSQRLGEEPPVERELVERRGPPGERLQLHQAGQRGGAGIAHAPAGERIDQIVGDRLEGVRGGPAAGLVAAQPAEFARGEFRHGFEAEARHGEKIGPVEQGHELRRAALPAPIGPEDQRRQGLVVGVEQEEAVGLRGVADGLQVAGRAARQAQGLARRVAERLPESVGIELTAFGRFHLGNGRAHEPAAYAVGVEDARFEVGGAQINPQHEPHGSNLIRKSRLRIPRRRFRRSNSVVEPRNRFIDFLLVTVGGMAAGAAMQPSAGILNR
ncbi:MAG: hypothetical protein BWZ08_02380 [candidate division BRC1 bacterium ADurb.BinA292]|nr:MAG: hypothetical protein BWZ08_02380 [candidate division BRC1 bacterium ADurb.BinA292]